MKILLSLLMLSFHCFAKQIVLNSNNFINIYGEISEERVEEQKSAFLKKIRTRLNTEPFYIVLVSNGGQIKAATNLVNYFNLFNNVHTITIDAQSAGAMMVQQIKGTRYVINNSLFMFHEISIIVSSRYYNKKDLIDLLKRYNKRQHIFAKQNYVRLKLTEQQFNKLIANKQWFIKSGKDAIKFNAADELIDLKCDNNIIDNNIKLEYYETCPLDLVVYW